MNVSRRFGWKKLAAFNFHSTGLGRIKAGALQREHARTFVETSMGIAWHVP
jgi:hypothetical protein